jgi:signal transduction histidine kinase
MQLQEQVEQSTRVGAKISKLNQELEQKNADLREIVSELESYSYSVSHDMRAPLRAMQGYADILLEEVTGLSDEHMGFLRRISAVALRLDDLIRDVLTYSQLSRTQIHLEPMDLHLLIHDITEEYAGLQEPNAEIKIIGQLPQVMANEAILTQCVANLLGNATKFVPPGVKARVEVSAEHTGDEVTISFKDNGIGISPTDIERIFNIFVKVHSPETYPGTGIGLSIVKKSAERMGGKVGVESELGNGSRFWLRLKAAPVAKE